MSTPHDLEKVLYTCDEIDQFVERIAREIDEKYLPLFTTTSTKENKHKRKKGKIVLIGILKGSYVFLSDLSRKLKTPHTIEFMSVKSYSDTKSTGTVQIVSDLQNSITGDHAIIVEDILDSGLTLSYLMKILQDKQPKSLEICTLLRKPTEVKVDIQPDYLGVDIDPPEFVIGYGLDYNQWFRNLDCIGVPTQATIEKYKGLEK